MNLDLQSELRTVTESLDHLFKEWLNEQPSVTAGEKKLIESMEYTLLNGGKRFRPALSIWVGEAYGGDFEEILHYAAAIEMVHTYSLIHDDLPCMDDDDVRRGRPANHITFGEDFALLAGDALLTEAFHLVLSRCGPHAARAALDLTNGCGIRGMVGGQAIDLLGQKTELTKQEMERLHQRKTGALIVAAVSGAASICAVSQKEREVILSYAHSLGYAFQVADDILDYEPETENLENIIAHIGLAEAKRLLQSLSDEAADSLNRSSCRCENLSRLIEFNLKRKD